MADTVETSSTPKPDVNDNMTKRTASQSSLLREESNRVKIVCLSGPIEIIVPLSPHEEMDDLASDNPDFREVGADTVNDNNNSETVQLSHPVDIKIPVEKAGTVDNTNSAPNTHATDMLTPTMEEKPSAVKQIDCNHPDETVSPFSPYIPGNEILLKTSDGGTEIKAVILKTFPTTLSCCMVLRFVEPAIFNNTSECVLKLYDRRFSNQLRENFEASPWTPELENEYQSFVECGDAEEFFSYWDAEKERDIYWSANYVSSLSRWSAAKREAYLQWDTTDAYETEKKAYEQMADLQGEDVPKIFGEVVLSQPTAFQGQEQNDTAKTDKYEVEGDQEDSTSTTLSEVDTNPHLVNIPGILMQHIDGFILTDLHEHLPKDCWQSIVDTAIEKLARIHESGILNRDVNTRSFMVDPLTRKVMMIDFGMVTFREDAEDDIEWERLYAHSDAEEAIGLLMRAFLKERGGGSIIYKPSEMYWRLQYRYRGMEGEREGGTEEEEEYVKENKDFVFE